MPSCNRYNSLIFLLKNFLNTTLQILLPPFSEKEIDLNSVDLKKLKVRDLKKILSKWGENCDGCLEKTDFIKRIQELKPKYAKEEL